MWNEKRAEIYRKKHKHSSKWFRNGFHRFAIHFKYLSQFVFFSLNIAFHRQILFINPVYYYFSVILSVKAFPVNIFQFSQIFLIPSWSVFDLFFFPFGSPRWKKGLSVNSLVREKEYRKFLSNFNFSLSRYCSCL